MAAATPSSSSSSSSNPNGNPSLGSTRKSLGFMANAMKRKESFIQFFVMSGVFMLSLRSLGQKYRIDDLTNDNAYLREENDSLSLRMASIKEALLHEASLDSSGLLASHLNRLFGESK